MKQIKRQLSIIALGLIATATAYQQAHAGDLTQANLRKTLQSFTLDTLSGEPASLTEHRGEVTVVSFWATWCEPCKKELNDLAQLMRDDPSLGKVRVLAIATDAPETLPEVRKTVEKYQWPFIVPLDPEGSLMSRLNPRGATPFSIFVDKEGKKAYEHEGYKPGDMETYRSHLLSLQSESAGASEGEKTGSPLAHFNLPGLDGETVRSDAYTDSPMIISFWATWCEPCKKELNDLKELLKKPRFKDVKVIAVATDAPETLPAVRTTVDEKAWPFIIALDSDGAVMARLNPRGATPFSIFVARGGVKLYEHEGYKPGDLPKYEAHLDAIVAAKGHPASKKASGPIRLPIHSTQLTGVLSMGLKIRMGSLQPSIGSIF